MPRDFEIDGRLITSSASPYIIAEMSANHNGDIKNAFAIIDMAKRCGADAVKMQTYSPDTITVASNKRDFLIEDGLWKGNTLHELYALAYTPWEWHADLFEHARKLGITIFSSPFDHSAVDLLESLNAPAYKIASFECIDLPLIKRVASTKKPLIISTGMANQVEIQEAVDTALEHGCGDLALLHCVSAYPAKAKDYNLATLRDMRERYDVHVGLSDHTLDNITAIASISLGATLIEKHVTLNRNGGGADDSFSLEENEFKWLKNSSVTAWEAQGEVSYESSESEKGNKKFRRSLYFVKSMKAGDIITEHDIRSIRPGFGLPPKYFDFVVGQTVSQNVEIHTPVTENNVCFSEE